MNEANRIALTLVVTNEDLDRGEVEVRGDEYRHLFRARRSAVGDAVRLTDGRGRSLCGQVVAVDDALARVAGDGAIVEIAEPGTTLIVPVLKRQRTAWMVEKVSELGVGKIQFYSGPRAPRTLTPSALERLHRIAVAAVAQSHGSWLPRISGPQSLTAIAGAVPADHARYVGDVRGASGPNAGVEAAWAIGPEGGWTADEAQLLSNNGFVPVRLAGTTLRAETAAIVAAAHSACCAPID